MTARYPLAELSEIPDDIREVILAVQEKTGFVPNVFLALARRPAELHVFFAYHDALMLREGSGLSKGDREMIVTSISAANQCLYCVIAHGALLRIYEKNPEIADEDAWEITSITAFFGISNRIANATGLRTHKEFFMLGRIPHERPAQK